jgi:hypothetical protein
VEYIGAYEIPTPNELIRPPYPHVWFKQIVELAGKYPELHIRTGVLVQVGSV